MIHTFETTFAVPLTCEDCIKDVSTSLHKLNGISHVSADLASQLVSVEGTAAPSAIVAAIQATGRDAILRGSGKPDSAAVCILERHSSRVPAAEHVRGLVRMVQVAPATTLVDLAVRGLSPGRYVATVRERGDISRGAESTGGIWDAVAGAVPKPDREGGRPPAPVPSGRGVWGMVDIGSAGTGSLFVDRPVQIWELVGRSVVVSRRTDGFDREDKDTLVGVVARSAGVWENDKTVCSCSGKTVWEERRELVDKGML